MCASVRLFTYGYAAEVFHVMNVSEQVREHFWVGKQYSYQFGHSSQVVCELFPVAAVGHACHQVVMYNLLA